MEIRLSIFYAEISISYQKSNCYYTNWMVIYCLPDIFEYIFSFFCITYKEGSILMIPCLIFLCQVGLHFCWVLNIFCTVKLISSFALFFPVCLELKSSFPIMSQFAWSLFTLKRHKCKFIRGQQNIFHQFLLNNFALILYILYLS